MKSYIKLFGPSIDRGIEALNGLVEELGKSYPYGDVISHIFSVVDPTVDMLTGTLVGMGEFKLGEYDFAVDWKQPPSPEQVRGLIRRIDEALLYTGCMYTITTTA